MNLSLDPSLSPMAPLFAAADDAYLAGLDSAALIALVERQVAHCVEHARKHFPRLPSPLVWCDLRGKSAGQAHFGRGGVRFNPILLADQPRAFLNEVVAHEVAHWVVHHVVRRRVAPHGVEWRTVMVGLYGLPPRTTHRFDTSRSSPAPYLYLCECRGADLQPRIHRFSERRHRFALRGGRYRCRSCGAWLCYHGRQDSDIWRMGQEA
ncbi:SprT-like domain-containing protein [Halotalea alkalilenta]|uniref:SprT family zinc-dependent metalloprotease n=1 Tax=Halotalea alkalilenta TaxID=376489 RepID=UPI000AC83F17|nr:SprT-like domain-containing protein [Halotalea alkalilenta]